MAKRKRSTRTAPRPKPTGALPYPTQSKKPATPQEKSRAGELRGYYGAPQFNATTKKVEKCTFCLHRLYDSSGVRTALAPACVTSCVGGALHMVETFNVAESGQGAPAGFASPLQTRPSTKFTGR